MQKSGSVINKTRFTQIGKEYMETDMTICINRKYV